VSGGHARAAAALLLLAGAACGRQGDSSGAGADPLAEARTLLSERRYDEVLARVGEAADPDSAYLAGRAWAGKAESAPVPTPGPGAASHASRLKPEEERALAAYERAVAARADFVDAHLGIAELLAPHALLAAAAAPRARPGAPAAQPDALVERVLRSYGNALQADLAATKAAEGLADFATRAGRPGEAEPGEEHGGSRQTADVAAHDQAPPRKKTTKPMRARASTKAMPRNIVVRTMPAASGWRAMAWTDWPTR
jgi:hypothetical protein